MGGARALLALLAPLLLAHLGAARKSIPDFYTRTDDFAAAVNAASAPCGTASRVQHDSGLQTITIKTGDAAAHAVHQDHPQAPVRALLIFGEHARELVPPELALRLVRDVCQLQHARDQVTSGGATGVLPRFADLSLAADASAEEALYATAIDYLVAQPFALKLVPVANPAGRRQVEAGDYCRRTNPASVDLNRNWDSHWQRADASTSADCNPGAAPFSEPETQALRAILTEFRPHMFLSVHSGTLGMFTPPAFAPDEAAAAAVGADPRALQQEARMRQLLGAVAAETGGGVAVSASPEASAESRFAAQLGAGARGRRHASSLSGAGASVPTGGAAETVGYMCPGTCLDYAFENGRVPFSFAFEIYGTPTVPLRRQSHRTPATMLLEVAAEAVEEAATEAGEEAAAEATGDEGEGVELHEVSLGSCFFIQQQEEESLLLLETESAAAALAGGTRVSLQLSVAERELMAEIERDEEVDRHPPRSQHRSQHRSSRRRTINAANSAVQHKRRRAKAASLSSSQQQQQQQSVLHARVIEAQQQQTRTQRQAKRAPLSRLAASSVAMLSDDDCLGFFNPLARPDFERTLAVWAARTARLLQRVHAQVLADRGVAPQQGQQLA